MVIVRILNFIIFRVFVLGKWDRVTGINSPLYRSHTELKDHEDWKNTVSLSCLSSEQ